MNYQFLFLVLFLEVMPLKVEDIYLEEDSIRWWNGLKHVTSNETEPGASGSGGDDVWKIQHGALYVRERHRDGLRRRTMASANVDQGAYPLEDAAALLDDDVHEEAGVRDHASVEELAHGRVVADDVPHVLPVRQLEEGQVCRRQLVLEPSAKIKERGHEDVVEDQAQRWCQVM